MLACVNKYCTDNKIKSLLSLACVTVYFSGWQTLNFMKAETRARFAIQYESCHEKTCLRVSGQVDSNWPTQLQRLVGVLKFRL